MRFSSPNADLDASARDGAGLAPLTPYVPLLALVALGLHVATLGRYGYFGDEFYYLDASRHLDWGYVEFPPASIAVLAAWTRLVGDGVAAIRLVPATLAAILVLTTGLLARALGGRASAQTVAALATLVCPLYLVFDHYYSPHAFDFVIWSVAALLVVALLRGRGSWLLLGMLLGGGIENRESVAWLAAGLAVGLVATRHRRLLLGRGPWVATAIMLVLATPYGLWQARHGWPFLAFVRGLRRETVGPFSPLQLASSQLVVMHPLLFPLWLAGLLWLLLARAGRPFAPLAIVYLTTFAILAAAGTSKAYYLAPAYPPLLAAGAVVVERVTTTWRRPQVPIAVAATLVAGGGVSLPLALPILRVPSVVAYEHLLGVRPPVTIRREEGELPGHFAGMQEWPEIVASIAAVYEALPADERRHTALFAGHWTDAAALNVLGTRRGLPRTFSGHDSYVFWNEFEEDDASRGRTIVAVAVTPEGLAPWYADVRVAGTIDCRWCLPSRAGRPILVARAPRAPFATFVAAMRHFD